MEASVINVVNESINVKNATLTPLKSFKLSVKHVRRDSNWSLSDQEQQYVFKTYAQPGT